MNNGHMHKGMVTCSLTKGLNNPRLELPTALPHVFDFASAFLHLLLDSSGTSRTREAEGCQTEMFELRCLN